MKNLENIYVPYYILDQTIDSLRMFGAKGCEGLVLWLGSITNERTCRVTKALTPPQDSIKSEDGVGYFVTADTLFSINKFLSSSGLRLLAQIHSHPGRAYHSAADDRYCIVTAEGGFSMVVPSFGFGSSDLFQWANYRLVKGIWEKLSPRSVRNMFIVQRKPDGNQSGETGFSIIV